MVTKKLAKLIGRIAILFTAIGLLWFLISTQIPTATAERSESKLPVGATNVVDKGGGWVYFTLDGRRFLYHSGKAGYAGFECITEITKD